MSTINYIGTGASIVKVAHQKISKPSIYISSKLLTNIIVLSLRIRSP